jgi:hypothetical protein
MAFYLVVLGARHLLFKCVKGNAKGVREVHGIGKKRKKTGEKTTGNVPRVNNLRPPRSSI